MRHMLRSSVIISVLLAGTSFAAGQDAPPRPDQRQDPQPRTDYGQERDRKQINAKRRELANSRLAAEADFAQPREWRRGSELIHESIIGRAGGQIGRFQDIVINPTTGRPLYGIISSKSQTNDGKFYAIPWPVFQDSGDGERFENYGVDFEGRRLGEVPSFTDAQWPDFNNRVWNEAIYREYGVKPYWDNTFEPEKREVAAKEPPPGARNVQRSAYRRFPASSARLSQLRGLAAKSADNRSLGTLEDVAMDPHTGRVLYGVIVRDNRNFAVPWSAISIDTDRRSAVISSADTGLSDERGFSNDEWPNLTDPVWAAETHRRFHVEPYWGAEQTPVERRPD